MALETEALVLDADIVRSGVEALLLDSRKGLYFVAETGGGTIIGQVMVTYEWSDWRNGNFWWLQSVYVEPSHRGLGVFRALYHHVASQAARDQEVCGLRLYMHHANGRARQCYEKLGMRATSYEVLEWLSRDARSPKETPPKV